MAGVLSQTAVMGFASVSFKHAVNITKTSGEVGDSGGTVVKVLCYKSEGR